MIKDELGQRMKKYENAEVGESLPRKVPVIIRIDGKAFHTFTKGFRKPFDDVLIKSMEETMKYLCKNIQGCIFGYTQSDEISLVLIDYQNEESDAWFGYRIQKISSIAASMVTFAFNKNFSAFVDEYNCDFNSSAVQANWYLAAVEKGALFDARCFSLSREEVTNYILWRQFDARRNSILSLGQAHFNNNRLHKKTCLDVVEMLKEEKQIDWKTLPNNYKFGSCCYRKNEIWQIDREQGLLMGVDRALLDNLVVKGEQK